MSNLEGDDVIEGDISRGLPQATERFCDRDYALKYYLLIIFQLIRKYLSDRLRPTCRQPTTPQKWVTANGAWVGRGDSR